MYTILLLSSHAIFAVCFVFNWRKRFRLDFFLFLASFANLLEAGLFNINVNWNILIFPVNFLSRCTRNRCTRLTHASAQFSYLIELTEWEVFKFGVRTIVSLLIKQEESDLVFYYVIDFLEYEMQIGDYANFVTEGKKVIFLWTCQAIIFPSFCFKILSCHTSHSITYML
jgi:hypothetical protein